ncbi:MAG: ISKra4 family transposase [Candidatus Binataceae bacterium]
MNNVRKLNEATEAELADMLAAKRASRLAGQGLYAVEVEGQDTKRHDGLRTMQRLFDDAVQAETRAAKTCPACRQPVRVSRRGVPRTVETIDGSAILRRNYHHCERCKLGFYPLDAQFDLPMDGSTSALMTRFILDFGLHATFEDAAERLAMHHGRPISENLVRLVIERMGIVATGDPMLTHRLRAPAATVPAALLVAVDGSMLPTRGDDAWRETKLGMVARSEHHSQTKNRGVISEARYVARMTGVDEFRKDLTRVLSLERAWECPSVAFLGDGAPWIWNMANEVCPNAVQIVDFMHAIGAAAKAAEGIFVNDKIMMAVWTETIAKLLYAGRVTTVISQLEECAFELRGKAREAMVKAAKYFENNAERMRYQEFLAHGLPIGSGMIESAHRYVLQARMKLAGQHWDPTRADRLAQLRAALATIGPAKLYDAIAA